MMKSKKRTSFVGSFLSPTLVLSIIIGLIVLFSTEASAQLSVKLSDSDDELPLLIENLRSKQPDLKKAIYAPNESIRNQYLLDFLRIQNQDITIEEFNQVSQYIKQEDIVKSNQLIDEILKTYDSIPVLSNADYSSLLLKIITIPVFYKYTLGIASYAAEQISGDIAITMNDILGEMKIAFSEAQKELSESAYSVKEEVNKALASTKKRYPVLDESCVQVLPWATHNGVYAIRNEGDETIVTISILISNKCHWLHLSKKTVLIDQATGDLYKVRRLGNDIPLDTTFFIVDHQNQYIGIDYYFPKLNKSVKVVDFIENDSISNKPFHRSGSFVFRNINIKKYKQQKTNRPKIYE